MLRPERLIPGVWYIVAIGLCVEAFADIVSPETDSELPIAGWSIQFGIILTFLILIFGGSKEE